MSTEGQVPEDTAREAAIRAVDAAREDFLLAKVSENDALLRRVAISVVTGAVLAERARIVARLLEEADLTPCGEDAMVTRSNAFLIKADFSYEEAERLSDKEEA
ncbi:hypothetical protein [Neorhizobium sp. S3-V5DH]|uniref:hypothetical protein n=1 Tax=Neorhizobium sp. S3-V5DH TaxID=2485166 RepID=UPI0010533A31|nr:hypothetical protein [Neorhizobium sp. S3-V5DH]TCV66312.1 hypothetical protein EDE09_11663 [Neorhizobium sp. S3-V5DH]